MWVRGLKSRNDRQCRTAIVRSHPMWVRGLKSEPPTKEEIKDDTSLPMRVRGLKFILYQINQTLKHVAPHVGAWIEIRKT